MSSTIDEMETKARAAKAASKKLAASFHRGEEQSPAAHCRWTGFEPGRNSFRQPARPRCSGSIGDESSDA